MALLIEAAPAGDQPEGGVIGVAVDGAGGELALGVKTDPGDLEYGHLTVGQGDVHQVPWLEARRDGRTPTVPPLSESTWPSMMDGPSWPGVGEYLYQAASLVSGGSLRGGTWMVPSGLSPTYRSLELTPMAGIEIEMGSDLASVGPCVAVDPEPDAFGGAGRRRRPGGAGLTGRPFPPPPGLTTTGPMEPACAGPGWGAYCWAATASPSTLPPAAINTTPVTIATIRLFVQAAMAGPRLGPARPLAVTRAGPWPVTPGQVEDDDAGQDDGPAHAEQGGILDAGRAAAARGGSAAGRSLCAHAA